MQRITVDVVDDMASRNRTICFGPDVLRVRNPAGSGPDPVARLPGLVCTDRDRPDAERIGGNHARTKTGGASTLQTFESFVPGGEAGRECCRIRLVAYRALIAGHQLSATLNETVFGAVTEPCDARARLVNASPTNDAGTHLAVLFGHRPIVPAFGGAGTVGLVADRLDRHAILCELKDDYAEMAHERVVGDSPMFAEFE